MTKMTKEEAVYVLNLLKRQDLKINSAATEAIDMAISALEKQEQNRWIPVTERMPEIHKDVLVRDREVSDVYVSYYCGGGYWNTDTGGANNRIIAWRPLPKPYTEEES